MIRMEIRMIQIRKNEEVKRLERKAAVEKVGKSEKRINIKIKKMRRKNPKGIRKMTTKVRK